MKSYLKLLFPTMHDALFPGIFFLTQERAPPIGEMCKEFLILTRKAAVVEDNVSI